MLAMWFQRVLVTHPAPSRKVHETPPLSPIVEPMEHFDLNYDPDMEEIDLSSLKLIGQSLRAMGDDFNASWSPSGAKEARLKHLLHVILAVGFSCIVYSCFRLRSSWFAWSFLTDFALWRKKLLHMRRAARSDLSDRSGSLIFIFRYTKNYTRMMGGYIYF